MAIAKTVKTTRIKKTEPVEEAGLPIVAPNILPAVETPILPIEVKTEPEVKPTPVVTPVAAPVVSAPVVSSPAPAAIPSIPMPGNGTEQTSQPAQQNRNFRSVGNMRQGVGNGNNNNNRSNYSNNRVGGSLKRMNGHTNGNNRGTFVNPYANGNQQFVNPAAAARQVEDKAAPTMALKELEDKSLVELRKMAEELGAANAVELPKKDLIIKILEEQTRKGGNIFTEGVLEIINDGAHGVLRSTLLLPGENDVYVSGTQIKRFNLRGGDFITGQARAPKEGERYLSLLKIEAINSMSPEKALSRGFFNKFVPIFPNEQIKLETEPGILSTRLIDMLAPIGKGQRGMIVAPPKAGKTWLLKDIAGAVEKNHPEIHLMILLIGERPEEVTDMMEFVKNGEVIASNFDEAPENHTRISELAIERAKRIVEQGKDVMILMDSITRLARAYNIVAPPSGRTLSGGFDPVAIFPPKRFFGAARNFRHEGSLTIIATALVETGSRMDEVIFEEFKGTGNMELKLDRKAANRRTFPAIDVMNSGTRNEDLLLSGETLQQVWRVRRMLEMVNNGDSLDVLMERLKKTKTNAEFLATLHESH